MAARKTRTKRELDRDERRRLAHADFHRVPAPEGAALMPRAGSLKSAALSVLYATRESLPTREVGRRIKTLVWAPPGWTNRRLATVLGEMAERDHLIAHGEPVRRAAGEGGPLHRKTWTWRS
jgi:hypothetical protein